MMIWWDSLTITEQAFASVAIPSTIILFLQTILLLFSSFGGDDGNIDSDHDTDFDHDHDLHIEHTHSHHEYDAGLRVFTVRGFVTFFCIFGWTGLTLLRNGVSQTVSFISAIILGLIFMFIVAFAFAQFLKLQSNGAIDINSAVGVSGSVYLTIPSARNGTGKVTAIVAGRYSEFDAVTDEKTDIPTNHEVSVVGISSNNTLIVVRNTKA